MMARVLYSHRSPWLPPPDKISVRRFPLTPAGTQAAAVHDEPRREQFRKDHKVRIVDSAHEGFGIADLPEGTYGFTYSPALAAPIFSTRRYQNFEIHKSHNGAKFILGYVTSPELADITRKTHIDVKLYPDAYQQSTELVCLSLDDVHPRTQNSGQPGSPVPLRYEP
jgi:hypothetical protein